MTETKQADPQMLLDFDTNGSVTLTVKAHLRPGARNWTAEEAGEWFTRSWQRAREALIAATVHRAFDGNGTARLVSYGDGAWDVDALPAPPGPRAASPRAQILEPLPQAEETLPELHLPGVDEPIPGDSDPEPEFEPDSLELSQEEVSLPRIKESIADNLDQQQVIRRLNRAGKPLTLAALCKDTEISRHRAQKAIRALQDKGAITHEMVSIGGRWGEVPAYYAAG